MNNKEQNKLIDVWESGCKLFLDGNFHYIEESVFDPIFPDFELISEAVLITIQFIDDEIIQFQNINGILSEVYNPSENIYD